jgi:hypothetical protein
MKHLRRFNESVEAHKDLQDFCEMNLAYLMDEGLRVFVDELDNYPLDLILSLRSVKNRSWIDIKDHIIPFFIRLQRKYEFDSDIDFDIIFYSGNDAGNYTDWSTTDDIINDIINKDWTKDSLFYKIRSIKIKVKGEKI